MVRHLKLLQGEAKTEDIVVQNLGSTIRRISLAGGTFQCCLFCFLPAVDLPVPAKLGSAYLPDSSIEFSAPLPIVSELACHESLAPVTPPHPAAVLPCAPPDPTLVVAVLLKSQCVNDMTPIF